MSSVEQSASVAGLRRADALYSFTDLVRMFKVADNRLREMRAAGTLLGPDVMIPGGGHKAARWSASRVREIYRAWSVSRP